VLEWGREGGVSVHGRGVGECALVCVCTYMYTYLIVFCDLNNMGQGSCTCFKKSHLQVLSTPSIISQPQDHFLLQFIMGFGGLRDAFVCSYVRYPFVASTILICNFIVE